MVCRERRDDAQMVRAGRGVDGSWHLGRGTGRGAWWCRDTGCDQALKAGHVARALRTAVNERDMEALRALSAGGDLK